MFIKYNGIDLQVERVVGWSDRPIYSADNSERAMRHVSLTVQCIVHPQATNIVGQIAFGAPDIVANLKRRLLEPCQELYVTVGDRQILASPQERQKPGTPARLASDGKMRHYCDAKLGPHPLYCDVVSIHGTKTMLCTFAIETWLVDTLEQDTQSPVPPKPDRYSALIAHRWTQSNALDEQYYSTRTTMGEAHFRADFLYDLDPTTGGLRQRDRRPADYIAELNHALPVNYRRELVRTDISSDGLVLRYSITDVEQESTIEASRPISKIRGKFSAGVSQPHVAGALANWGWPTYFVSLAIDVRGRRGARHVDLVKAALRAATTYDSGAQLQRRMYFDNRITVSIEQKQVSLSMGWTIGGAMPAVVDGVFWALGWAGLGDAIDFIQGRFPEDMNGNLGAGIRTVQVGQQPHQGMIGHVQGEGLSGGQRRLYSGQVNDGQFVPTLPPNSVASATNQTDEASAARTARGDAARPQDQPGG